LLFFTGFYTRDLSARRMLQSCMAFRTVVGWGRYLRPRCPIWIPPLSIPTGLRGDGGVRGQRSMHPSDRLAGGRAFVTSSQAFRASRMLVERPWFPIFEFRYSGGKTPLVIVTMFGMFAIASLTWLHRICISRLHRITTWRCRGRLRSLLSDTREKI
jgi:hypothetical protein